MVPSGPGLHSPTRRDGWGIALAIAALPFVAAALLFAGHSLSKPVFPHFRAADIGSVTLSHQDTQLVLSRGEQGGWAIPTAADAPADGARIDDLLDRLSTLRGRPLADTAPPARQEPLRVALTDRAGAPVSSAGFRAGEAVSAAGERLQVNDVPALALWPSAWTTLRAPTIAEADIARVEALSVEGAATLDPESAATVRRMLSGLNMQDMSAAQEVDWGGAQMVRVHLASGDVIDMQIAQLADGTSALRLASDTREDVRRLRRLALKSPLTLPR